MAKFKVGDIARVVRAQVFKDYIGKEVKIISIGGHQKYCYECRRVDGKGIDIWAADHNLEPRIDDTWAADAVRKVTQLVLKPEEVTA